MQPIRKVLFATLVSGVLACSGSTNQNNDAGATVDSGTSTHDAGNNPAAIHGCDGTNDTDSTAISAVRIVTFGGDTGLVYSPKCLKIAKGQSVTFNGDFATHPLVAGEFNGTGGSANSPIVNQTSGDTISFTFTSAGVFPYHCNVHAPDMAGLIRVE